MRFGFVHSFSLWSVLNNIVHLLFLRAIFELIDSDDFITACAVLLDLIVFFIFFIFFMKFVMSRRSPLIVFEQSVNKT